jgi:hypothetical protein
MGGVAGYVAQWDRDAPSAGGEEALMPNRGCCEPIGLGATLGLPFTGALPKLWLAVSQPFGLNLGHVDPGYPCGRLFHRRRSKVYAYHDTADRAK